MKVLLTVFFDCNGVVHHKFLSQGRTVNKEYYLEVTSRLCKVIRQKCTEFWKNQSWILRHDNAPAHTSILVHDFLGKKKTVVIPQRLRWLGHVVRMEEDAPARRVFDADLASVGKTKSRKLCHRLV